MEDIFKYSKNQEFERNLQIIFDNADIGIGFASIDGVFINANPKLCNILGVSKEEILKRNFRDFTSPKDKRMLQKVVTSMLLGKLDTVNFENRTLKSETTEIIVSIHLTLIKDKNDKPEYFLGIIDDITEQKKISSLLDEQIRKNNSLLSNLPGIAYHCLNDENWTMEYISDGCFDLTGYKNEELYENRQISYNELIIEEDREYVWEKVQEGLKKNQHFELTYRITSKSGNIKWVWEKGLGVCDANNKLLFLEGFIHDITAEKEAIIELEKSEERIRQVFEITEDCIWEVNKDGLITNISKSIKKQLGYNPEEIIDKVYFFDFFKTSSRSKFKEKSLLLFKEQKAFKKSVNPSEHKDGSIRLIETSGSPIFDYKGNFIGFRGINKDITEEFNKNIEILRAKEKAEKSDKLKTSFIQNMSHEIRTPLNGIVGFSKLLYEIDDYSKEEIFEIIDTINISADRLLGIIDDVMSISHIDSGMMKVNNTEFKIEEVFRYIENIYKSKMQNRNLELIINYNNVQKNSSILFDKDKLYQILINLINNALKFTESGSIEIGVKNQNKKIAFYVKDTGIGIAKENQSMIFNRFWQYEAFSDKKYGGTGLGLSIIKGLADLCKSTISVESELNKGSTFIFEIENELIFQKHELTPEKEENILGTSTIRILIAEDEFINYSFLARILQKENIEFDWAKNGLEAIELFHKNKYNIVLMDLKMPLMNGFDAAKKILEINPDQPIVAQTAYSHFEERQKAQDAGCCDIIVKPINKDQLLRSIATYMKV